MVERCPMTVYVVTYPTPKDIKSRITIKKGDVVIGVDQAVFYLYKQRINIDLAVGDFDSLKQQGLLHSIKTEKLPVKKDVTDTFYAIERAYEMSPDEVILLGGDAGERIEHMVAHMMLFHHFKTLKMITERSKLYITNQSIQISHQGFINIFPYPEAHISLEGFEYSLEKYHMQPYDMLGISNQLIVDEGTITLHRGCILIIETNI